MGIPPHPRAFTLQFADPGHPASAAFQAEKEVGGDAALLRGSPFFQREGEVYTKFRGLGEAPPALPPALQQTGDQEPPTQAAPSVKE